MDMDTAAIRPRRKPLYRDLSFQVAVAMVAGVLLGLFLPRLGAQMQPLGDAFIRLIRMLIAPIIFCTVVHGITSMGDLKRVGRVALKSLLYFEVMTTLALIFGLTVVNLWQPGAGMNIDLHQIDVSAARNYVSLAQHHSIVEFLVGIIPTSAVGAFASGDLIAVLFFSVLFAIALCMIGDRAKPTLVVIESVMQGLFAAIRIVMGFAPIGAFGSIAFTVGRFGAASLVGWAVWCCASISPARSSSSCAWGSLPACPATGSGRSSGTSGRRSSSSWQPPRRRRSCPA